MATSIEFFYDFVSPAAYLAWTQLRRIENETGAKISRRAFSLGHVFKKTGNAPPMQNVPAKGAYMTKDFLRTADALGVPMQFNPAFPFNSIPLLRGALAADQMQVGPDYRKAIFTAIWVEPQDVTDPDVIKNVLQAQRGLDADAILALSETDEIKKKLKSNTEEAIERGAFGAPSFFVGEELFWGSDRIEQVIAAAKAA